MAEYARSQFPFIAELNENANRGAQRRLVIAETPAGAESLVGKYLDEVGALTTAGDYYLIVPIGGLGSVNIHLKAAIAAGTATTAGSKSLYAIKSADGNARASALLTSYGYQALTGVGALVADTLQTLTLTSKGELYAIVKLTLATSPNVTFAQAESNGTRQ